MKSLVHKDEKGKMTKKVSDDEPVYIYSKGAPEELRKTCDTIFSDETKKIKEFDLKA